MSSARRADPDQPPPHAQPSLLWSQPAPTSEHPQRTSRKTTRGQESTPRTHAAAREYASDARSTSQPVNNQYYASTASSRAQPSSAAPQSSHVRGEVSSNAATYGSSQGRPTPSQTPTPTNVFQDVYQLRAYMQQARSGKPPSKEKLVDKDRRPGSATPQPVPSSAAYPTPVAPTPQNVQHGYKDTRPRESTSRREAKESERRRDDRYRDVGRETDDSDMERVQRHRDEKDRERSRDRARLPEDRYRDRTKDRDRDPRNRPPYQQGAPTTADARGRESDSDSSHRRMLSPVDGSKKYHGDDRAQSVRPNHGHRQYRY
jgi:hypothetical protein